MDVAQLDRFEAAKQVIRSNCVSCHYAGSDGGNLLFETEDEYRNARLVTPGSVSTSKLITRLRNSTAPVEGRTMPPDGPIPAEDFAKLTAWVSKMHHPPAETDIFSCSPDEAPSGLDARRLSKTEMQNTLHLILRRPFGTVEAGQILANLDRTLDRIPSDLRKPFSRSDRAFESAHAEGHFELAEKLANAMTTKNRYSRLVATYVNYSPDACTKLNVGNLSPECRDAFINNFLLRLWGRPLEPGSAELTSYQREFSPEISSNQAVNNFLFRALLSPQFQHHLYTDVNPTDGSAATLSSFAVARRLSYHFQLAGLDESLIQIVSSSNLNEDTSFPIVLNKVSQSPEPMLQDFTDDWLKLYRINAIATPTSAKWKRVAQGINLNADLKVAMRQEIIDFVTYLYRNGRPVQELMTSNISLARNPDLMKIYGQTTSAPSNFDESTAVRLPASERAGVMTRAGYLYNSGDSERPVIRGLHVMADFLCAEVNGRIPANASATPLPKGLLTTREKYNQITSGNSCIGCHRQINPIGNAFAKYNAFGGFQHKEPIFVNGIFSKSLPTNGHVDLQASVQENVTLDGGVDFSQWVAASAHFRACFSRQYQAYIEHLNSLPTTNSSCDMHRMSEIIRKNGSLAEFFRTPIEDANFRKRNIVR